MGVAESERAAIVVSKAIGLQSGNDNELSLLDDGPGILARAVVVRGHGDDLALGKLLRRLIE